MDDKAVAHPFLFVTNSNCPGGVIVCHFCSWVVFLGVLVKCAMATQWCLNTAFLVNLTTSVSHRNFVPSVIPICPLPFSTCHLIWVNVAVSESAVKMGFLHYRVIYYLMRQLKDSILHCDWVEKWRYQLFVMNCLSPSCAPSKTDSYGSWRPRGWLRAGKPDTALSRHWGAPHFFLISQSLLSPLVLELLKARALLTLGSLTHVQWDVLQQFSICSRGVLHTLCWTHFPLPPLPAFCFIHSTPYKAPTLALFLHARYPSVHC